MSFIPARMISFIIIFDIVKVIGRGQVVDDDHYVFKLNKNYLDLTKVLTWNNDEIFPLYGNENIMIDK